jgi:hypothetical protein
MKRALFSACCVALGLLGVIGLPNWIRANRFSGKTSTAAFNVCADQDASCTITGPTKAAGAPLTLKAGASAGSARLLANNGDGWVCTNSNCSLTVNGITDIDTTAGILNLPTGVQVAGKGLVTMLTMSNPETVTAATVNTDFWTWKGSSSATISECRYSVAIIGVTGGTCTYALYDATAGAVIGSISLACTAAVETQGSFTGGALTNAHIYDLRVTAPASDTAAKGSMICSIAQ